MQTNPECPLCDPVKNINGDSHAFEWTYTVSGAVPQVAATCAYNAFGQFMCTDGADDVPQGPTRFAIAKRKKPVAKKTEVAPVAPPMPSPCIP